MKEKIIEVNEYLTLSKLPACDYVINPYVGCPHGCKYCYASFMKRFTGHDEAWGTFIDIKKSRKKINIEKLKGKTVFLSSVTDCYNEYEKKYEITRGILEQLRHAECNINISTKSNLILRDIDILKDIKNLTVAMSINTLNEEFKKDMDKASSIKDRLSTLKRLHEEGIYTILFMSPIFPYITEWDRLIEETKDYIDEYWFENLNLRGSYKTNILEYIKNKYPEYYNGYLNIYTKVDKTYWEDLSKNIEKYCEDKKVKYTNYFYHEKIAKK